MEKKEAIKILKDFHDKSALFSVRTALETLYPELKENEDEKIRKGLIKLVQRTENDELCCDYGHSKNDFLVWLEKQGEQKPFDYENANIQQKDWAEIPFGTKDSELQEATYIIPEGFHAEIDGDKVVIKKGEQKPAWSEEDERAIGIIKIALEHPYAMEGKWDRKFALDWLKSLKDRVQPKQEWSEEDENRLSDAIFFVREYQIPTRDKRLLNAAKETEDWLRTFKERLLKQTE